MSEHNRPTHATPPEEIPQEWLDAIFAGWSHRLSPVPMLLLIGMAIHADQETDPPTFEGTWENLAWLMQRDAPSMPDRFDHSPEAEEVRRARERHHQSVRRALDFLIETDAVRVLRVGEHGQPSSYGLYMTATPGPVRDVRAERPGWIYYLKFVDCIKIGWATNVARRIKSYPPGSDLLASHPGTLIDEAALHERFRDYRIAGREWFAIAPEIMEHIATL